MGAGYGGSADEACQLAPRLRESAARLLNGVPLELASSQMAVVGAQASLQRQSSEHKHPIRGSAATGRNGEHARDLASLDGRGIRSGARSGSSGGGADGQQRYQARSKEQPF